jgi:hypothetical protein
MKRAGLAATIKARWICEQAHQQLKEKLGLDHFEGRSWQGLHRHALMTMIAYAFLQHRHLTQVGRKKESTDRRLSLACRPYATPSSISFFDHYLSNAHTAEDEAVKNSGVGKSAKVVLGRVPINPAAQLYEGCVRLPCYRPRLCGSGLFRQGPQPEIRLHSALRWRSIGANFGIEGRTDWLRLETIFMAIRLLNVVCLAALVVFPAHSQSLPAPDQKIVAITTYFQFITEDDVDQRTKLNLLLAQKQVGREDVINELVIDMAKIVKAEGAGLLSDALVDKAFADMCSRLNVAPVDLMNSLEEKGIRLDTLRKRLKSDVAREHLARKQRDGYKDQLDYPLIPKM